MNETVFSYVARMNQAFGNPRGRLSVVDWTRLKNQCKGVTEELGELSGALTSWDRPQVRDSLCDIAVFALGAFHFAGADYDAMTANITDQFHQLDEKTRLHYAISGLGLYVANMHSAIDAKNTDLLFEALIGIIGWTQNCYGILFACSWDGDMRAVLDGVMTRFCKTMEDQLATQEKYADLGVMFYTEGDFPTVRLKSTIDQIDNAGQTYHQGKFLKSVSYKEPDFS